MSPYGKTVQNSDMYWKTKAMKFLVTALLFLLGQALYEQKTLQELL